jgi:transposase
VLEGLRGEHSIAKLCRIEGINQNLYYRWSRDFLGQVGNSGNTTEPHLQLHAQKVGRIAEPINAEPMLLIIDGQLMVRNSLLK